MTTRTDFNCVLIGGGALLARCGDLLSARGHSPVAVVSRDGPTIDWAASRGLSRLRDPRDLLDLNESFDYLFSIVHTRILSPEILELPRHGAINFHDAYLPEYRGVHATSWALIEGRRVHGVTWHLMDARADEGAILEQRRVPIDETETAFSLNLKCLEAGFEAFRTLLDDLASNRVSPRKQAASDRPFYSWFRRPDDGCVLDWRRPAREIAGLVRGLNLGSSDNRIGIAKLAVGETIVLALEATALASAGRAEPGTILAADGDGLRIATAEGDLRITEVVSLDGAELSPAALLESAGQTIGERLPEISTETRARVGDLYDRTSRHEAFWRRRLARPDPILNPYRREADSRSDLFGTIAFSLPDTSDSLASLTAVLALLSRIGDGTDVRFRDSSLADLVRSTGGLFAGWVPLRLRVETSAGFADWRRAVTEERARLQHHLTYPHDLRRRFRSLREERTSGNSPWVAVELVEGLGSSEGPSPAELTFVLEESGSRGVVRFDTGAVAREQVERLVSQLRRLAEAAWADPDGPIDELPLLSEEERRLVLHEWNDTGTTAPPDRPVQHWFEDRARDEPDLPALVFGERSLTYRETDERANALAQRLRDLGAGPGKTVGLCLPRGPELPLAILGILKSGAAYLPIDPEHPVERNRFMSRDGAVELWVTQRRVVEQIPDDSARRVQLEIETAAASAEKPSITLAPDDTAYVIYTSGSTGRPKGVEMPHRSLANLIEWQLANPRLSRPARTLQFASPSFDVSFQEIFTTWSSGGALVIVPEATRRDPRSLWRFLVDAEVERLFAPYVVLQELAGAADRSTSRLADVVSAGERLRLTPRIRDFFAARPGCRLHNHYGPTESHVATSFSLPPDPASWPSDAPIGRPIARTRAYVLDERLEPVPIGVAGELCLAGACLAHGYRNSPDLTAERFVPDPFGEGTTSRIYRTGDRCRFDGVGQLEFLGRVDDQVKVRGVRVELGEIEAALNEHEGIRGCVVTYDPGPDGSPRLAAYYVPEPGVATNAAALREHVAGALPPPMIPSAYVPLERLPKTRTGKIDRRALPTADVARHRVTAPFVAPRDDMESNLCAIWCDVLELEQVGIDDDFFSLGGHSLLATRLITRIAEELRIDLSLRELLDAPTVRQLASRVGGRDCPPEPRPERRDAATPTRLSFGQQRLWFLQSLESDCAAYNMPFGWLLRGALDDVEPLRRAIETIVQRHEILRTVYPVVGDRPRPEIRTLDRFELPLSDAEETIENLRRAEAERPFDLARDLPLRARLLRLGPTEHLLLITFHHIATDGRSWEIFRRELEQAFEARRRDDAPRLPELATQYVDFAVDQRRRADGPRSEAALRYWRDRLADLPTLELPKDRKRPEVATFRGASHRFEIDPGDVERLEALGRDEGSTLQMTLLAAFQTLLWRYSGQDDFAVGVPIDGRDRPETEALIGFFVNMLVMRAKIPGERTFREWLRQVRADSLDAYDHRDLPFERLVEELRPERRLDRNPLVQVSFQLMSFAESSLSLAGLETAHLPPIAARVRFDLELHLWHEPDRLHGAWVYSTDLFEAATIGRMAANFSTLLHGIVKGADRPLHELPFLSEAERETVVSAWNRTETSYPRDRPVHRLFEDQVDASPDAMAVVASDRRLTYRELNARANRLARSLRDLGVGPASVVGLCLDRSTDLVVGMLGILKAGGAYLPLDGSHPPERLRFTLDDAAAGVLLTTSTAAPRLAADLPARVLRLDELAEELEKADPGNLGEDRQDALSLAYVMYTSGSTGRPKGVEIGHRSIARLVRNNPYATFGNDRVFLQLAPPSFDASTFQIWGALLHGARLVIAPATLPDLLELEDWIKSEGVTTVLLTTAPFNQIIEARPTILETVDEILVGGEALSVTHVRKARKLLPRARLINGYGPTESTTFAACYSIPDELPDELPSIPIGPPIANTVTYVLDPRRRPLPIGVAGELHIGGDGLARGYRNRPDLTAESFVPDPFDPGRRVYRTGDLCRWRADGTLEFLGRVDDQIKIRGLRVEPGEIESLLREHPAVRQAVVCLDASRSDEGRLVAYWLPEPGRGCDAGTLARHLASHLPATMVPQAFVTLAEIPLTASGKVDRRALPAPDPSPCEPETPYAAPRNPIEQQLASIWCELLDTERVGVHDDFFALGGHSLLATRAQLRIVATLQVDLPLRLLFEARTIGRLAREIETLRGKPGGPSPRTRPPIATGRSGPLPLSSGQERLWFLEQMEGESVAYNMPFGWRLRGDLDVEALRRSLERIVHRHEALRTNFILGGQQPAQVVAEPRRLELDVSELRGDLHAICGEEAERAFDLRVDSMLRARLIRVLDDEHVMLLTLHHIAADGWSVEILRCELETAYAAYRRGEEPDLPELPVQYADYALAQREESNGERARAELAYWKHRLAGLEPLELPTDRPRPPVPSHRGGWYEFRVDASVVSELMTLSRQEGVSLQMTLLAAFQLLLSHYSGQSDIAVGTPIAGRRHVETDKLIGFFVNTLVLRTDLGGNPTFRELLDRVREVSLDAYDHQELPFERLVELLQPERQRSRNPLFQVLFQLLSFSDRDLVLEGLDVHALPSSSRRARLDLEMHLWQQRDGLRGALAYSTDLFDRTTMERMTEHFRTLLSGITAGANRPIREIPWLPDEERHRVLVGWNEPDLFSPGDRSVHELFEDQVRRRPDDVAVETDGSTLSYSELNRRANRLAGHLRSRGVAPDTAVGLCVPRSPALAVGILGILKAGGAYVPLDPDYPEKRLEFMLRDAEVGHLVTERSWVEDLPQLPCPVTLVDADADDWRDESPDNPPLCTSPGDLAYVLYTSGSSGQPKGVEMPHGPLVNLIEWHRRDERLGLPARTVQFAPCSFDVSFQEILSTWCTGGTLVLIREATRRDPGALWRFLVDRRIERLFVPYVGLQALATVAHGERPPLRDVISAGETLQLTPEIRELFGSLVGCRLHNHYGPSETHLSSALTLAPNPGNWPIEAPIGHPVSNTQSYVLDEWRQPVAVGIAGELYIGGAGLARGYRNRPELTAQRFVPHPFDDAEGALLYRTSDRCSWRPDGTLQFLGRFGTQVKLRGFRLDLGEIESVLHEHPRVRQSLVLVREDRPGDRQLVAYCTGTEGAPVEAEELKRHLRSRLPDYMVPAAFVTLDSVPMTPSGKLDRRALPEPEGRRSRAAGSFVAPRNALERGLAEVWCETLALDRVGTDDNFFDIGGHSLLAVRVVTLANRRLGRSLRVADLFAEPTIAGLATRCGVSRASEPSGHFLEIVRPGDAETTVVSIGIPLPLLSEPLPQSTPLWWLKLDGFEARPYARVAIPELVRRYAEEIVERRPDGPLLLVGFSYGGLLAHALACRLQESGLQLRGPVLCEPTWVEHEGFAARTSRRMGSIRAAPSTLLPRLARHSRFLLRRTLLDPARRRATDRHLRDGRPLGYRQRWDRFVPDMLRNARDFTVPTYPGSPHLVGRSDYLTRFAPSWRPRASGKWGILELRDLEEHNDLITADGSHRWLELLRSLL